MKKYLAILIGVFLGFFTHIEGADCIETPDPKMLFLKTIPLRQKDAITGSEFARRTARMPGADRQKAAFLELRHGNMPNFLRQLKPVRMSYKSPLGREISAIIWVMPDYLAIGSDKDFLRIPLTFVSAARIANYFNCLLPTRKIVDDIFKQSAYHLKPQPLPPGPEMRSIAYYMKHQECIETQRTPYPLGELISGHKKDTVLTNLLRKKHQRVAIYGWHRPTGKPIQPLSIVHGKNYVDYSHGIRLISSTVWIDGEHRSIFDVLEDRTLARILTYEGTIPDARGLIKPEGL